MIDALTHLVAKQDIADVLFRYGYALDGKDWNRLRSCFTPDAAFHYGGYATRGYPAIELALRAVLEPLAGSQHLVGSVMVAIDDIGNHATSSCYVQAQHVRDGEHDAEHLLIGARYVDRLVRTEEDGWRITDRSLEVMWTSGNDDILARPPQAQAEGR